MINYSVWLTDVIFQVGVLAAGVGHLSVLAITAITSESGSSRTVRLCWVGEDTGGVITPV